ncbi:hypothetical protein, partial [Methylobacterium sp. J-076]|uniref:hypothetical protein n=1 Tax=Methylobacterium sp. J-076 TaxID=2836655 RepID=UPI001FBAED32
MTASTRRAALGAILAAPLTSVPAAATPSPTRALARLVHRYERLYQSLVQEGERLDGSGWLDDGTHSRL